MARERHALVIEDDRVEEPEGANAVGRSGEALTEAMLDEALRDFEAMGLLLSAPHTRAMRADVHAGMGQVERADADLDDALAICARTGEAWPEAELYRRKGVLRHSDPQAAEACFRRSLARARDQGARLFELRTAVSLARLWEEQGMTGAARNLLAPVYAESPKGLA